MDNVSIISADADSISQYAICGYKNKKSESYQRKLAWTKARFAEGLRYKLLYSEKYGAIGGIEYIPGEYAWRPVLAKDYMVIHCIYIMRRDYKARGYGWLMLKECIEDAKQNDLCGVVVITRKGTWMPGKELFEKHNFEVTDTLTPDFNLCVYKFNKKAEDPKFNHSCRQIPEKYTKGLHILFAYQCPYLAKTIPEIKNTVDTILKIPLNLVELVNHKQAQQTPCAFGSFCLIYNGKLLADRPIGNTRFMNIMTKELKK